MKKKLSRNFYTRNTLKIAQDLLGKFIIRKVGREKRVAMIVETEAYPSSKDRASHAFGGKRTLRNAAEYLIGGHIYIYLVYGMYWQLNISTGRENSPECVLIRAIEPTSKLKVQNSKLKTTTQSLKLKRALSSRSPMAIGARDLIALTNGPGKLCRWLKLDKSFYAEDLTKSKRIWLEDRGVKTLRSRAGLRDSGQIKKSDIAASPRINIDYAGSFWAKKPWRFYIKNNKFVSKAR